MEVVRETTIWDGNSQPNHVYLMDGNRAVAYIPFGKGKPFYFKSGITLDKRGRKFEVLKTNPFKAAKELDKPSYIIKVQGSNGKVYEVNTHDKTCTCPGYTFRGTCKHVKEII